VATTVVSLRLAAAVEARHHRQPAVVEEERAHSPRAWGPLLPDGPVYRSFDRTDPRDPAHVRNFYST